MHACEDNLSSGYSTISSTSDQEELLKENSLRVADILEAQDAIKAD